MVKHIVTFKLAGSSEERRLVAESFRDALMALPEFLRLLFLICLRLRCMPSIQPTWLRHH